MLWGCRCGRCKGTRRALGAFVLLSHGKPGQTLAGSLAVHADADHRFGCRAGGAQHRNGRQSLVIEFGDEEGLPGIHFLPYLTDLDSLGCHYSGRLPFWIKCKQVADSPLAPQPTDAKPAALAGEGRSNAASGKPARLVGT